MSWTDEKVAKLKELWGKGSTASQIAEISVSYTHLTLPTIPGV